MAVLWVAGIPTDAGDDELMDFLERYGFPLADAIAWLDGDGSQPAALVTFERMGEAKLRELALRIDGVFWNESRLHASVADSRHM